MAFLNEAGLEQVWGKIKTKVSSIENTISDINKAKVDKISGKGLSTNDYTTNEKNKLAGIATGATKVIVDSSLSNTSTNAIQNKVVTNMKTNIDDELSNKPSKTGDGASGTWGINISGNAATATKATKDGSGNVISSTYLKLSGGTINGVFRVRHDTNHPYLMLESSSYNDYQSQIYYSIPSSSATANFGFREYSRSSSDHTLLSYYEEFELPSVTSDKTSNSTYRILTSKFTVSVAQGGTGAATKSGARSNLGITSGTSLPSASGYSAGDIFILY